MKERVLTSILNRENSGKETDVDRKSKKVSGLYFMKNMPIYY